MTLPAWPLLLWSGAAATCAAATAGTLIGGRAPAAWSLVPRSRSRWHAFGLTIAAGLVLLPLFYGFLFELMQRSSVATGLAAGVVHAAAAFALAGPRDALRPAVSAAVVALVYAAFIALLYVTP